MLAPDSGATGAAASRQRCSQVLSLLAQGGLAEGDHVLVAGIRAPPFHAEVQRAMLQEVDRIVTAQGGAQEAGGFLGI
jgi:hypothetical protein